MGSEKKTLHCIFDDASHHTPEYPCSIWMSSEGQPGPQRFLSFRQAQAALLDHTEWIKRQLRRLVTTIKKIYAMDDVVIAYLSHNSIDLFLSVLACADPTQSASVALLNTRWTAKEMIAVLESTDKKSSTVTMLLYSPLLEETAFQVRRGMTHLMDCLPIPNFAWQRAAVSASSARSAIESYTRITLPVPQAMAEIFSPNDYLIVFTSGTSKGSPKGVCLSHRAIAVQCSAKCQAPCNYEARTRLLGTTVPFFHIGGISSLWAVWMVGGCIVMPPPDDTGCKKLQTSLSSFDPAQMWTTLVTPLIPNQVSVRNNATDATASLVNTLVVVPAMVYALQQTDRQRQDLSKPQSLHPKTRTYPSVTLILVGGQSLSDAQRVFLSQTFPCARVVQTYACTEAASSVTFHMVTNPSTTGSTNIKNAIDPGDMVNKAGDCVGRPPPHVTLCLVNSRAWTENKQVRLIREPFKLGLIATKGPHVMNGYWKRGQAHLRHGTQANDHCGWFVTTDLGCWDSLGQLYFCGRNTDAIRTGGETVWSSEVERILLQHPMIQDCAVFPLPDDRFGQVVSCAVVLDHDSANIKIDHGTAHSSSRTLTLADIRQWCMDQGLGSYKRPRKLFFVRELPKNSSGKTLKFLLTERFQDKQNRCRM